MNFIHLTVRKTASIASLKAATTFVFFSLNFSKIGVVIMDEYWVNFLRSPVANRPMHLAARTTTITLASLEIICERNNKILETSENKSILNSL